MTNTRSMALLFSLIATLAVGCAGDAEESPVDELEVTSTALLPIGPERKALFLLTTTGSFPKRSASYNQAGVYGSFIIDNADKNVQVRVEVQNTSRKGRVSVRYTCLAGGLLSLERSAMMPFDLQPGLRTNWFANSVSCSGGKVARASVALYY